MTYASQARFGNYNPSSFGWGTRDPGRNPSLLVPFSYSGVSFGSMHRDVVGLFTALLDELVPLIPGGLVAGQCGCFNPSSVTVGGSRSFHTYAIAIDINWGYNPMYAPSHPTGPHTLPSATSGIARSFGCEWGGDWTYPQDWMHIETHLTPAVARTVKPTDNPKELDVDEETLRKIVRSEVDHVLRIYTQVETGEIKQRGYKGHQFRTVVNQRLAPVEADLATQIAELRRHVTGMTGLVIHGDETHPNSQDATGPVILSKPIKETS